MTNVPPEWLARSPTLSDAGWSTLSRLLQHPDAPRWNFETGDRMLPVDLDEVSMFRESFGDRGHFSQINRAAIPPDWMFAEVESQRSRSWWFEANLPFTDLGQSWGDLPTMTREDLSTGIELIVPHDIDDFEQLLVYDTSGTTGHAVHYPHHPKLLGKNQVLAERALADAGVRADFAASEVSCANVCAQQRTYVFASTFGVWNHAGFVKVNLATHDWSGGEDAARRYLRQADPQLVTSDPASLVRMLEWEIPVAPRAILSTALELPSSLRAALREEYDCPVVDWYSTTETGPIAYSWDDEGRMKLVCEDAFVEVVDADGRPVPEGELGEVVVTTGRNPFVYLFRYRTGDFARLERGDVPALHDFRGRGAVWFQRSDGEPVNSVDIARAVRLRTPIAMHAFVQHADRSVSMRIRPVRGLPVDIEGVEHELRELFGGVRIAVTIDPDLGSTGKVTPYRSELEAP